MYKRQISYLDDNTFVTGSVRNRISIYDINRRAPIWQHQWTKQSCGKSFHKAIISCFDECNDRHDDIRYAGTYKTELLRFDTRIKVAELVNKRAPDDSWSTGIYQILRSGNGHYLYCLKRNAREIDVVDIRMTSTKANTLQLPYKVGRQKFKASLNSARGLLIGSYDGNIISWDKDCVEFGGLDPLQTHGTGVLPTGSVQVSGKRRINCISSNPIDPDVVAISCSTDKFDEDIHSQSSIDLIQIE